jgi:hypothetical protein
LPKGFNPTGLSLVASTGPDRLAIIGNSANPRLALIATDGTPPLGTVDLASAQEPIGLAISPGGHWAYVLEQDASQNGSIQAVDLTGLQLQQSVAPSQPFPVGTNAGQVAISPTGRTLYVPLQDGGTPQRPGGIAVIDVSEANCQDIPWRSLEGCPACCSPNCVVLATIENYHAGDSIEDPPPDPRGDPGAHIARIDNRKGRCLVPSTQTLYELIQCIASHASGTPGPKGDAGPRGDAGPGLETGLTRIQEVSWNHNSATKNFLVPVTRASGTKDPGIVIRFSNPVRVYGPASDLLIDPDHVFEVLVRERPTVPSSKGCRCPMIGEVIPVKQTNSSPTLSGGQFQEIARAANVNADLIAFVWSARTTPPAVPPAPGQEVWVSLRGDFVLDTNNPPRAIDAEFVRADFPTGERPKGSPLGIEGGTFESWFTLSRGTRGQ